MPFAFAGCGAGAGFAVNPFGRVPCGFVCATGAEFWLCRAYCNNCMYQKEFWELVYFFRLKALTCLGVAGPMLVTHEFLYYL